MGGPGQSSLSTTVAARVEEIVRAAEQEAAVMHRDLEARRAATEMEAARRLEDARREAESLVHRRIERMRELTDEVVERAQEVSRHFDALIAALEDTTAGILEEAASTPRGAVASRGYGSPPPALRAAIRTPDELRAGWPSVRDTRGASRYRPPGAPAEHLPSARAAGPGARTGTVDQPLVPVADVRMEHDELNCETARLVAIEMAVSGRTRTEVEAHLRAAFGMDDTEGLLDDVFGTEPARPELP